MEFLLGYILGRIDAEHPRAVDRVVGWFFEYLLFPVLGFCVATTICAIVYDWDLRASWVISGTALGVVLQVVVLFWIRRQHRVT